MDKGLGEIPPELALLDIEFLGEQSGGPCRGPGPLEEARSLKDVTRPETGEGHPPHRMWIDWTPVLAQLLPSLDRVDQIYEEREIDPDSLTNAHSAGDSTLKNRPAWLHMPAPSA